MALECNGGPNRMDLGDVDCRRCRERDVLVGLHTDAHAARHLGRHEFALAMARRGWLESKHVLNTQPWERIAERRARRLRDHGDPAWRVVPALVQVPVGFVPDDDEEDDGMIVNPADRTVQVAEPHAWVDIEPLEEAAVVVSESEPETEPVSGSEAAADGVDELELAQLVTALRASVLSEATNERLAAWLMSGAHDPTLERALGQLGDNALQVGFDLLTQTHS